MTSSPSPGAAKLPAIETPKTHAAEVAAVAFAQAKTDTGKSFHYGRLLRAINDFRPLERELSALRKEGYTVPPSPSPTETYWMIERGSPAEWWAGNHTPEHWTREAHRALHFDEWGARHHLAELKQWGLPQGIDPANDVRVTEHIDMEFP